MTTATFPFIKNDWTISISDIPAYPEFKGEFTEPLDAHILQMFMETTNPSITPIMKQEIKDKLLKNIKQQTGELSVYHHQTNGLGRFYPNDNISLIPHSRYIKHTVFKYLGWKDIDMVKGHMTIALEMGKSVGLAFNAIQRYVSSFPEICEEMREFYQLDDEENALTDDDVKWLFCVMMYGGGLSTWVNGLGNGDEKAGFKPKQVKNVGKYSPFAQAFKNETKTIIDRIYTKNNYLVRKLKKPDEELFKTKGSVASYWFQTIENHILHIVYCHLVKQKLIKPKVCGLEYDGLCLPPLLKQVDEDKLIEDINTIIRIETGLNVRMKFKDYPPVSVLEEIIEQRRAFIPPVVAVVVEADEEEEDSNGIICKAIQCDTDGVNAVWETIRPLLKVCRGQLFMKTGYTWLCDIDKINNWLLNWFMTKTDLHKISMMGKIPYSKNVSGAKSLTTALLARIKVENIDDELYNKFITTTTGRLCFRDGMLDFKARRFYNWQQIHDEGIEYYSCIFINRDFEKFFEEHTDPNHPDIKFLETDVFEPLFNTKLQTALQFLSRGLAGMFVDKSWAKYIGNRNCGKGVFEEINKNALGDYFRTVNSANILASGTRHQGGQDQEKLFGWALSLQFARLGVFQELPSSTENNKLKIDGVVMKKLFSGGDTQKARVNYGQIIEFIVQMRGIIFCNDCPPIEPADALEHCYEFDSVVQFKTQDEIDRETNPIIKSHYRLEKPEIKDMCKETKWLNTYIMLLFHNWVDKKPHNNTRDEIVLDTLNADGCFDEPSTLTLAHVILQNYDIDVSKIATRDEEWFVSCPDIVYQVHSNRGFENISATKIGIELKQKLKLVDGRVYVDKKRVRGYWGLKLKEET